MSSARGTWDGGSMCMHTYSQIGVPLMLVASWTGFSRASGEAMRCCWKAAGGP